MNDIHGDPDAYRSLQLMTALEDGAATSQRELAGRLGIAVGLVNSYLKNFVAKGFIRVKAYPRNRYAYLLTPKGFAEKSRLAYQHLGYFTSLYTTTRQEYLALFRRLRAQGVPKVVFCGVDEVAEIAYLSLQEARLELAAVIDDRASGQLFFGHKVEGLQLITLGDCPVVLSTLKRRDELSEKLMALGVARASVISLGPGEKSSEGAGS